MNKAKWRRHFKNEMKKAGKWPLPAEKPINGVKILPMYKRAYPN